MPANSGSHGSIALVSFGATGVRRSTSAEALALATGLVCVDELRLSMVVVVVVCETGDEYLLFMASVVSE